MLAGALWWASRVAYSNTSHRALSDLADTARVTAEQEEATWASVLDAVRQAAALPSLANAARTTDRPSLEASTAAMVVGLPIDAASVYSSTGQWLAGTGGTQRGNFTERPAPGLTVEPITVHGTVVLRRVRSPIVSGAEVVGQLVVEVDMTRLMPSGAAGRFGATGSSSLVTRQGVVVSGADREYGQPLQAAHNLAMAASGVADTAVVYSPYYKRTQVEAFQPLPDQDLGVLTVQSRAEMLASARQLRSDLDTAAWLVLALGLGAGSAAGVLAAGRRRRADAREQARTDAESRMRVAWETSPLGMTLVRLDGTWQAVNPAACAMFGAAEEELVGASFVDFTHPDDRHIGPPQMARLAAGHLHSERLEKRYVRPDGTVWWGSVTFAGVPGPDGNAAYVIAEIEDITASRQARTALEDSESRYRSTLDTLEEGVVSYDIGPQGPVVSVANPAAKLILGEDIEGTRPLAERGALVELRDEGGDPLSWEELPVAVAARTGRLVTRRLFEVRHADGHSQWLSVSARPVVDDAGAVRSVTASFSDVTAARLADAAVEAAHARAEALVEHGTDLITVSDAGSVIAYANPAFIRQLGWRPEELIGRRSLDWVHPDDLEQVEAIHADLIDRPGGVVEYECRLRHSNGTWRQMEVVATNHLDQPAIVGIVSTHRDITERAEAVARLAHQATHDDLTGLPNRTLLLDHLHNALARGERSGDRCAVLFMDLDQFKTVNDSLGHAAGDELLRTVAERLRGAARPGDTVARFGGDEFVVLAEKVPAARHAAEIAERVRAAVSQPVDLGRQAVAVSCSVGIAMSGGHNAESLLQEADTALYRAKGRGRNRWEMYDHAMRTVARRRLDTETELRRALTEDRISVAYQPIVRLDDARLVGVEALVRMVTADGKEVLPEAFIEVAEDSGLIVPLGEVVLDKACAQASDWNTRLGPGSPAHVSVNLSAHQLAASSLPNLVSQTLSSHHLSPGQLCLELTESVLIEAVSSTRRTLQSVADMGVQLALDDFGTGWSSLAYLRRFPISLLKIDRSFVAGLGVDDDDLEVIRAVIGLGEALNLSLTAEGVETDEQARLLRQLGCHNGQGWLYGRPAGAGAVDRYVEGVDGVDGVEGVDGVDSVEGESGRSSVPGPPRCRP